MKLRYLLPLLALALSILACKKEKTPDDPNAGSTARFKVTGVKDIDLSGSSSGSLNMSLQITTNAGALPDTVTLQVQGLPQGITTTLLPGTGKTNFASRITFTNNYNGPGGNFNVNVVAYGKSGTLTYPMVLSVPGYIGWAFNDTTYSRSKVVKDAGSVSGYPYIYIDAVDGSRLVINFPYKATLPTKSATYKVGASPSEGTLQLQFLRDTTQFFVSTGIGNPTASFSFDSLGKFIFKCSNVQMSNGVRNGKLNVSVPE